MHLLDIQKKHHIIPVSLGGCNKKHNIVRLSAREHFICHYLLTKIYKGSIEHHKMLGAFMMMRPSPTKKNTRYHNSKLYNAAKMQFAKHLSVQQKANNSRSGIFWIYNAELEISKAIQNGQEIPLGWNKGRVINFESFRKKQYIQATVVVKDINGNVFRAYKNDPRYLSGELMPLSTGTVNVKDKEGKGSRVSITDPRYISGELVSANIGIKHTKSTKRNS